MINLRFPNITGKTEQEQLVQLRSYLHQLVQEMNYVLTQLEAQTVTGQELEEKLAALKQEIARR